MKEDAVFEQAKKITVESVDARDYSANI